MGEKVIVTSTIFLILIIIIIIIVVVIVVATTTRTRTKTDRYRIAFLQCLCPTDQVGKEGTVELCRARDFHLSTSVGEQGCGRRKRRRRRRTKRRSRIVNPTRLLLRQGQTWMEATPREGGRGLFGGVRILCTSSTIWFICNPPGMYF